MSDLAMRKFKELSWRKVNPCKQMPKKEVIFSNPAHWRSHWAGVLMRERWKGRSGLSLLMTADQRMSLIQCLNSLWRRRCLWRHYIFLPLGLMCFQNSSNWYLNFPSKFSLAINKMNNLNGEKKGVAGSRRQMSIQTFDSEEQVPC